MDRGDLTSCRHLYCSYTRCFSTDCQISQIQIPKTNLRHGNTVQSFGAAMRRVCLAVTKLVYFASHESHDQQPGAPTVGKPKRRRQEDGGVFLLFCVFSIPSSSVKFAQNAAYAKCKECETKNQSFTLSKSIFPL